MQKSSIVLLSCAAVLATIHVVISQKFPISYWRLKDLDEDVQKFIPSLLEWSEQFGKLRYHLIPEAEKYSKALSQARKSTENWEIILELFQLVISPMEGLQMDDKINTWIIRSVNDGIDDTTIDYEKYLQSFNAKKLDRIGEYFKAGINYTTCDRYRKFVNEWKKVAEAEAASIKECIAEARTTLDIFDSLTKFANGFPKKNIRKKVAGIINQFNEYSNRLNATVIRTHPGAHVFENLYDGSGDCYSDDDDDDCGAICFSNRIKDYRLGCGRSFCSRCILECLMHDNQRSCALCRANSLQYKPPLRYCRLVVVNESDCQTNTTEPTSNVLGDLMINYRGYLVMWYFKNSYGIWERFEYLAELLIEYQYTLFKNGTHKELHLQYHDGMEGFINFSYMTEQYTFRPDESLSREIKRVMHGDRIVGTYLPGVYIVPPADN